MNRTISAWVPFGLFIICFILFAITKLNIIGVAGDIFLLVAIVVAISNYLKARRAKQARQ